MFKMDELARVGLFVLIDDGGGGGGISELMAAILEFVVVSGAFNVDAIVWLIDGLMAELMVVAISDELRD